MKCEECGEEKSIPINVYVLKNKEYEITLICPCEYYDMYGGECEDKDIGSDFTIYISKALQDDEFAVGYLMDFIDAYKEGKFPKLKMERALKDFLNYRKGEK